MASASASVPGETAGIIRPADPPKPKILRQSRTAKRSRCPDCGYWAYRDKTYTRTLHDLGNLNADRPIDLAIVYAQYHCSRCKRYFNADLTDLADPNCQYTRRAMHLAVRLVVEDGLPYRAASWHLWRDHRLFVPWATLQNWVEAEGKKSRRDHHRRLSG